MLSGEGMRNSSAVSGIADGRSGKLNGLWIVAGAVLGSNEYPRAVRELGSGAEMCCSSYRKQVGLGMGLLDRLLGGVSPAEPSDMATSGKDIATP